MLWVLTSHSTVFQLYREGKFVVHMTIGGIITHN